MKDVRLEIRATAAEMAAWKGAAALAGLPLSVWVRLALKTSAAVEGEMVLESASGLAAVEEVLAPGPLSRRHKAPKEVKQVCDRCKRVNRGVSIPGCKACQECNS